MTTTYFNNDATNVSYMSPASGAACRSSASKHSDICDLRDFNGLDLTGSNDCTSVVANAMTQGGPINVPAGTIAVTNIQPKSNTWLKGAGKTSSIFKFTSSGTSGLYSSTKGTSQLFNFRASDIQFLDDGGLSRIVDMTDMQFCQFERCFTYGFGNAGSVGIYMGSTNTTLQCTYNRIQDHYSGNVQYGQYLHDGANANIIDGGRIQSGVASAIGIILAPSGAALVNGNTIIGVGIEQPSNTLTGIQLNGNTHGTTIVSTRMESLLNGLVISATDQYVAYNNLYFSGCTNNIVDASNGKALIGYSSPGSGVPIVQFNYTGSTSTTNKAVNCSIARSSAGVYVISGLPFADMKFACAVSSNQAFTETVINSATQITVSTFTSAGVAADAVVSGAIFA